MVSCSCSKDLKEGITVLRNDAWHSDVINFRCFSSRILRIKFKFLKVKLYVVVVYGTIEGDVEERRSFCNDLDRVVDRKMGIIGCVLGDLNGWFGERVVITGS